MKVINEVTKRVVGGSSFSDSIIRTNASTEEYVKYVLSVVSRELFGNENLFECICDMFMITILCDGKELFSLNKDGVERFRKTEVLAFDKFILEMIRFCRYEHYKDSDYYNKIKF